MNCTEARQAMNQQLCGDLEADQTAQLEQHLQLCSDCRQEHERWQRLRHMLDAPSTPTVSVDVAAIYGQAEQRRERQLRRWRRVALAGLAVAASLLLVLGLKLEVRLEPGAVSLRWGKPPEPKPPEHLAPSALPHQPPIIAATVTPADVQLIRELVHVLAQDVETRDRRQQEALDMLATRLDELQTQTREHWRATARDVAGLYALHYVADAKGAKP